MSANGYLQLAFYVAVLLALAKPLGAYMARIYEGQPAFLNRLGAPIERLVYRLCGVDPEQEMRWTQYALAALWRTKPRISATSTAMPVAAETKFCTVRPSIWVR